MTWFVDYRLNSSVSVADRAFSYGDGVFETIRVIPQCFFQLNDHLSRMYRGLTKLGMPLSFEQKQNLTRFLHDTVLPFIDRESVVKIIVSRGEGGRGYLPPNDSNHTIVIGILSAPDYQTIRKSGVSLSISPVPVNKNRFLAGIKHLNRLENIVAKRFLLSPDFEAIMLSSDQRVIECIQSNLFWFKSGILYTPALSEAGVQGTFRQAIVKEQTAYVVQIGNFGLSEVKSADEVFISNSLMGIVPVTAVGGLSLPIGIHTRKLQKLMQSKDVHAVL